MSRKRIVDVVNGDPEKMLAQLSVLKQAIEDHFSQLDAFFEKDRIWKREVGEKLEGSKRAQEGIIEKLDSVVSVSETLRRDFDAHVMYHKQNEHRWGLWTFLKKKPLVSIIVGMIFASAFGISLSSLINGIAKKYLGVSLF